MEIKTSNGKKYFEGNPNQELIHNERDTVDLIGFCGEHEAVGVILYHDNLPADFFDLKTGKLGTILQKFVTYHLKVALVISPAFLKGHFQEFAIESNRGNHFRTFSDRDSAKNWLVH